MHNKRMYIRSLKLSSREQYNGRNMLDDMHVSLVETSPLEPLLYVASSPLPTELMDLLHQSA